LSVFLTGLFVGLALGTRLISVLLIPIFVIIGLSHYFEKKRTVSFKKIGLGFITTFLVAFLVFSSLYGFQGSFKSLDSNIRDDPLVYVDHEKYNAESISNIILGDKPGSGVLKWALESVPIIVPYTFLKEFWSLATLATLAPSSFLLGKHAIHFWYYFPVTFLVKMHLLILFSLLLTIILFKKIKSKSITEELLVIAPFLIVLLFFMIYPQDVGVRYLLPGLPFLFIFVSRITRLVSKEKLLAAVLGVLSIWYVVSAIMIFPHHFAYFNEIAGGPENGYKVTVGGNLDLGENMIRLKEYMDENGIETVKLSYEGGSNPEYYGINYDPLPTKSLSYGQNVTEEDCGPTTGIVVVSATNLQGIYFRNTGCFDWIKEYEPIDKIGYSLFVYNITET